ncbi:MAG: 16S rRNA (uracil(1498)-N(3))-methyltransferase [Deltaproteobacteria bacterium]|nr:16S rRNA (uracil(1498)-N(3))-methyltransferase [Deltaproteobacteria bacterium]
MSNFAYTELTDGKQAIFVDDEFLHQVKVLRQRPGDQINFLDGRGGAYQGKISKIDNQKKTLAVEITEYTGFPQPLPLQLLVALPKAAKIDAIIQKAVELGVSRITPLLTARTIVRIDSLEKQESRHQHWRNIAVASLKQSGGPYLPVIDQPTKLIDLDGINPADSSIDKIVFHPQASQHFADTVCHLNKEAATALLLGPEGGLSEEEIDCLTRKGYMASSLGKRILRLETAVVTALTLVQFIKRNLC